MIDIEVLGPVRVLESGVSLFTGTKERALVAAMAIAPGFATSHDTVTRQLWPDEKEVSPARIRGVYRRVRERMPEYTRERNEGRKCTLVVDKQAVDLLRFRFSVAHALSLEGPERTSALGLAVDIWNGPPLSDLDGIDFRKERLRLAGEFLSAFAGYLRDELACGDTARCRQKIEEMFDLWVNDHHFARKLLLAVSRRGDSDATRDGSHETNGRHDISVDLIMSELKRGMRASTAINSFQKFPRKRLVPRQLPTHRTTLVGREVPLDAMSNALLGPATAGSSRLVVLRGLPGVGKTALALRWAQDHQNEFPDGTIVADLQGFSSVSPADPDQILAGFFEELGLPQSSRSSSGRNAEALRTQLEGRRVLFILDNVRDAEHVRPLLPANGSSAAIVTSRDRLDGLVLGQEAHAIDVGPLDDTTAIELLKGLLGPAHVSRSGYFVLREITSLCAGLPLALNVVGASIKNRQPGAAQELLASFRMPETRLMHLDLGHDASVPDAFAVSIARLSAPARALLWRLALHPGPTISAEALAWLAEGGHVDALRARRELESCHLLDEPTLSRYSMHDLLRVSVLGIVDEGPSAMEDLVRSQIFDFLLHNARACDQLLVPDRKLPVGESDGVDVVIPESASTAMTWLSREYDTITAAIRQADSLGLDRYVWLLPMTLVTYQWRKSRYADAIRYLTLACGAAERVAGPGDQAMVYRMLAGTELRRKQTELAKLWMRRAFTIVAENTGAWGEAENRHGLGIVHSECEEWDEAVELISSAVDLFRSANATVGEAGALAALAQAHFGLEAMAEARLRCDEARALVTSTADKNGLAGIMILSGRIFLAVGDDPSALTEFRAASRIYRDYEYDRNEIHALLLTADTAGRLGRDDIVETALDRATAVATSMDDGADLVEQVATARQRWVV